MSDAANLSFSIDPSGAKFGSTQVVRSLEDIKSKARESANQFSAFESAMKQAAAVGVRSLQYLGAGFAGMKIASLIKQTVELGARYEELGIGLRRVGANVGASAAQINSLEVALKRTGISAIQSRQSIMSMIQANMDLTQATKLARVAQDAAVVGQLNSSDALQRIIYGLQTAQPEMLRTLGLTVNFEQAYANMAKTLNVSQNALTNEQKAQARLNSVMEAGGKITGLYEASMTSASKQLRSATRYVEDLQVKLGGLFQPAYGAAVDAYTGSLKAMAHNTDTVVAAVAALATAFTGKKVVDLLVRGANAAKAFGSSFKGEAMRDATKAAADATFQTLRQATAEQTLAKATLKSALAEEASAKTKEEKARATIKLIAAETAATEAERVAAVARAQATAALQAHTIASQQATVAQRVLTEAWAAGSKVLAFFGGPIGLGLTVLAGVTAKLAYQQRDATKYLEEHADSMQVYLDRVRGAKKAVEDLTEAERRKAALKKSMEGAELKEKLDAAQGSITRTKGGGFWGALASSFDEASLSPKFNKALYQVQELGRAFANDKDIKKYQSGLTALVEKLGPLTSGQREYFMTLMKSSEEVEALGLAYDVYLGKTPAIEAETKKVGDAFTLSTTQIEAFNDQLRKTNDSQGKLALAQKIGVQGAENHAKAAANLGMTIEDFERALNGSTSAAQAAAKGQLDLVTKASASDKAYAKLQSAVKVTKEEVAKFTDGLQKQLQQMKGTRTEQDEFNDSMKDLKEQAAKLGPTAKAALEAIAPAMEAAFGRAQLQKLKDADAEFAGMLRSQEEIAKAAEKSATAHMKGRDAVNELAVQEAGLNAIRGKSLDAIKLLQLMGAAMNAERRRQAAQAEQERGAYMKSTAEQIAAMNAEAEAYEKGGEAVKQYTFKLKFLEALKNGAKTANEAFEIAAAWEQAQNRLDKAKGKIDSVKEAMLEATRGIQRSIAGLIGDAFNGSLKDARAYGQQLIGIFRDIAAQIVAAFAFKKLGINKILEDIGNGKGSFAQFIKDGGMLKGKSDLMKGASAALVGGTVGYAVGGMTDNKGLAALGGAASGAAAGAMVAGPIGAVVGGVAGLVGGLLGHAKRMREEQKRIEDVTRQFSRSMQDFVESFITPASEFDKAMRSVGESALKLAQEAAAKYSGIKLSTKDTGLTPDQLRGAAENAEYAALSATGKKANDLRSYANDLRDIADKTEAAIRKMIENQVKLETGFNQELKIRELLVAGRTDEADAMRLQMAQQRELDDAKLKGFTETTIKELERVQALEASTAALERAKRAEKERADFTTTFWERFASVTGRTDIADTVRADNQRTSDKTMADDLLKRGVIGQEMYDQFIDLINKAFGQALADRAQGYADRSADLDVRMQVATGNQSKADDMAFRLSQERELRDAMKDTSASGIAYANTLKEVQAAETVAREAAKKQRVEDATADLSVRMLSAQGRSAEAEQAAFQLQQQREMREALKDTSAEGIAYAASLKQVQEAEAAAREAAKKRAEVEANMSIDARMLRAQGKTYEADTITTQIARSKEIEEATTEELKARLKLLHTLEDEERARQLAKSNQIDFNSMMVESLQLQGRTAEAAKMEFDFKQIMFREELDQKLINKQITQATFDLGLNLIKLRKTAFDQAQSDALNQTRASEQERSASITEPSPTNSSGSFSYDANAILTSMLIAQRETAYNTGRMAAMAGGGASGTAVNVTVNVSGGSLSGSATEVGNTIGAAVTRQVNEALGRAASTEIRNQGDIS